MRFTLVSPREVSVRHRALWLGLLTTALLIPGSPASASSDTSVRWDSVSEASSCGEPYTRTPMASHSGVLSSSQAILGPFGTYFGRSVAEVRSHLVLWTVPWSGGKRVLVHEDALPAFQEVAKGLAAEAAAGRVYPITSVSAFNPRTIDATPQISRHALGIAIDINYPQNPYRADGALVTNMPSWFVDVWRNAGFCWGGDWAGAKDPMHLSWMGPRETPGMEAGLDPLPPSTTLSLFSAPNTSLPTVFAPVLDRYAFTVADASANGAPDVVGLRSHPDGAVIDVATSDHLYGQCSILRWFVPDSGVTAADHTLLIDVDGDSRQDLVTIKGTRAEVATRAGGFADLVTRDTSLDPDSVGVAGADYDGDHRADLWSVSADGTLRILGGDAWTEVLYSGSLPDGAPSLLAVADRDGGDTPEIFALYPSGSGSRLEILRLGVDWQPDQSLTLDRAPADIVSLGAVDYDGDGRADVEIFDSDGNLTVYLGNSSTGHSVTGWFVNPNSGCRGSTVKLAYDGQFYDDDGSVHENGIDAMAAAGITTGCNPPFNDMFCPERTLTRAEAATLLARALSLPDTTEDYFTDDDGNVLEGGINRLAAAGITKGCNPPANDHFCPGRYLSRAEFATFIARALALPPTDDDYFTDDDGNVLEGGINRLAAAGITKGCNPPANTEFCPDRDNTRAEAATFLTRALP